jgi:hypothetical protein
MNVSINDTALITCPECRLRYAVVTESCGMVEVLKAAPCPHCIAEKLEGLEAHASSLESEFRSEMDTNAKLRFALRGAKDHINSALREISNAL